VLGAFAPLFSKRIFEHVKLLGVGAILAPGKRTVTSVLRVMGKADDRHFQNYHRVLSRARWPALLGEPDAPGPGPVDHAFGRCHS
jgi:hypothetical protein